MNSAGEVNAPKLDAFRPYLRLLARLNWDDRLNGKMELDDLVQQVMLEAHRDWPQFRGNSDAERAGWLARILAHQLGHFVRYYSQAKRDVGQEVRLDALEASSLRLDQWLAAEQSSPSERAQRNERGVRLAAALEQLPEIQREAIILRHLQNWSVAAIARSLGRTTPAVAGLLQRGLKQLRLLLAEGDSAT
jgi:RNA polymerase sigma-70 factor (ECF subfamily)